jgi:hypothetical protein
MTNFIAISLKKVRAANGNQFVPTRGYRSHSAEYTSIAADLSLSGQRLRVCVEVPTNSTNDLDLIEQLFRCWRESG